MCEGKIFFSWAPKSVIVTAIMKLINHEINHEIKNACCLEEKLQQT